MIGLLSAALALPLLFQDSPAPGFTASRAPYPGGTSFSATTTLDNGDLIVFDGLEVVHYEANGALVRVLGSLAQFAFPSFVVVDDNEQMAVFGESSQGNVYRLLLGATRDPDVVANLPFNYDAALRGSGPLYVSAAACGFGCGNEIWSVDLGTFATRLVARTSGASGPVALDSAGNLFYATASSQFPSPPKPSAVWRWSAAQILGPAVLDLQDAIQIGGAYSGASRLVFDDQRNVLYLAENNFTTGENRIRRVQGAATPEQVVVEGRPFLSLSNVSFLPGAAPAQFRAFQPTEGGTLVYTTTDFGALTERIAVTPRRARVTLSGPGTLGPGDFTLAVQDGPPRGSVAIVYGPRADFSPTEQAFLVNGLPLFFGLAPASSALVPGLIALDPSGAIQRTYTNPGGLEGQFAFQLLLLDASHRLAGTSDAAFL